MNQKAKFVTNSSFGWIVGEGIKWKNSGKPESSREIVSKPESTIDLVIYYLFNFKKSYLNIEEMKK